MRRITGTIVVSIALAATGGCGDAREPPAGPPRNLHLALPVLAIAELPTPGTLPAAMTDPPPRSAAAAPADDGFPGELASIATETSIYDEPRWASRRLGYLRAGAVVRRAAEPTAAGARCPEGWYRVEPRGFVCVGPMATLDVHHPVVVASSYPPRFDGLPWLYVLSRSPPPPLYARLPSLSEQLRFEPDSA